MNKTLLALILIVVVSLAAHAQTVEEIVGRYVEAIGGQQALDGIRSIVYVRELNHIEQNRVLTNTYFHRRPDLYRYESGTGSTIIISNGDKAWRGSIDKTTGQTVWSSLPAALPNAYILNRLGQFLDYQKRGIRLTYIGESSVDGVALFQVSMEGQDGNEWSLFFNAETGLLDRFIPAPGSLIIIKKYERLDGILFPVVTEGSGTSPDGTEFHHINTIKELRLNVDLDDSLFKPGN